MISAPLPDHEQERLAALQSYDLLDSAADQRFDQLVRQAADHFDVPICLVSLIDERRQWFKAKVGLEACETGRDEAFCGHTILKNEVLVVPDVRYDERFANNPLVTGPPGVCFYAGAPLIDPQGHALGTLCIIDHQPRELSVAQTSELKAFARRVLDQAILHRLVNHARKAYEQTHGPRSHLPARVHAAAHHHVDAAAFHADADFLQCLARAAEQREDPAGQHVQRVSRYTELIAQALGLPDDQVQCFAAAAALHDLGKVAIPDHLLLKPGKLTPQEFEFIKSHAYLGHKLIQQLITPPATPDAPSPTASPAEPISQEQRLLHAATRIAASHHERFDGTGYPHRLAGQDIPLEARIVALADVYDALSSEKLYKRAYSDPKCFQIIRLSRSTQFDPDVVDAFLSVTDQITEVRRELGDAVTAVPDLARV